MRGFCEEEEASFLHMRTASRADALAEKKESGFISEQVDLGGPSVQTKNSSRQKERAPMFGNTGLFGKHTNSSVGVCVAGSYP